MTCAGSFCFVSLFHDDVAPVLPSIFGIFVKYHQISLLRKLIDIGLGAIYTQIGEFPTLQNDMFKLLPSICQSRIKSTMRRNRGNKNTAEFKSTEFMHIRHELFQLRDQNEWVDLLYSLCDLLESYGDEFDDSFMSNALKLGFERYKHEIHDTIIDEMNALVYT